MFFEFDENGKILVCSSEKLNERMKEMVLPEDFNADNIQKYIARNGEVLLNKEYKPPINFSYEDRMKKIEDAIALFRKLLGVKD